ncbi:MAG TPA: GspH/FimT family pseudopilin [Allosphingosinicella sp.]
MPISAIGIHRVPPLHSQGRGTARSAVEGPALCHSPPPRRSASRSPSPGFGRGRNGFTSSWRSAVHGFTLVELLIVLAIIGLMSALVVLAIPDPRGTLAAEAERFAARTRAAQERAVMDNRPVAVRLDSAGYGFEWREEGEWRPIARRPFEDRKWIEGTSVELDGKSERIAFDSTGFAEPAEILLARGGERVAVEVADGGKVHVRR